MIILKSADCIFDIGTTTCSKRDASRHSLWIAFRLYLWHWNHNCPCGWERKTGVVNCFQIVSLTLEPQLISLKSLQAMCCELLSDCIFDIGTTTPQIHNLRLLQLWIAFRLYLWHWNHNILYGKSATVNVVNCFQIVSLTLEPQRGIRYSPFALCCELLSDCIFDIGTTTAPEYMNETGKLWIAFRLYLWHWNHNCWTRITR